MLNLPVCKLAHFRVITRHSGATWMSCIAYLHNELQILSAVALMEASNPTQRPAKSRLVSGTWRLLWSQQAEDASPLQKWGSSQSKNYQVRGIYGSTFKTYGWLIAKFELLKAALQKWGSSQSKNYQVRTVWCEAI